jgi:hypothetical protein
MKFAWIENGKIRDVAHSDPNQIYHPDVAKFYDTQVPDDAANGDGWVNGQLVKPEPPAPPPPAPPMWTADDVRLGLSLAEKVKWDNDTVPEVKTAKTELAGSNPEVKVKEVLDFLVATNVISQASADKVIDIKKNPVSPTIPVTTT